MATYVSVIKGLTVFAKYEDNGHVQAEHDEIFAGCVEPKKMSKKDRDTLEEYDWMWREDLECWKLFT